MKITIVLIKSFAHPVIFTWYLNAYLSPSSDHLTHTNMSKLQHRQESFSGMLILEYLY